MTFNNISGRVLSLSMVGYETALVFQKMGFSVNSNENAGKRMVNRTSAETTAVNNGEHGCPNGDVLTHLELGEFEPAGNGKRQSARLRLIKSATRLTCTNGPRH